MKNGTVAVACAAPKVHIADPIRNADELIRLTKEADAHGAALILFPELSLATAEISQKIARGKHTTRHVELFPMDEGADAGFLADTPGFSLIDFERFDFFSLDDLLPTFRELVPYVGKCRYADCAHVGEGSADCAVARAEEEGRIAPSRLASYRSLWRTLKAKNAYK